ncbi:DNA-3-methyladenine glycosylase I [Arcicella lustrica]|uniref:DNA-3-methyladenine glycosylase I n=1 Tax=Arcicella lustrica TaxID=2984196 RepID=A0ABU5SR06_9BACT|nr:DNA-3-methyladenine glycosylase I [Arcicella sp. DC25W]MEA5429715.1 DNA-3-methyladenine glycosylase I [Arcicella sp. DC25W]
MSYCSYIEFLSGEKKELHKNYHDNHYGFPIHDDDELFGRLILEINQAGLSWETILKKEASFRKAYKNFSISQIAAFDNVDIECLLAQTSRRLFPTTQNVKERHADTF